MHYLVQLYVMNSWNRICSSDIDRVLPNQKLLKKQHLFLRGIHTKTISSKKVNVIGQKGDIPLEFCYGALITSLN